MKNAKRSLKSLRLWLLAGFLVSVSLIGCKDSKPILIGFVAGTSGSVADLGVTGRDAAQLVIEQCNRNGGVAGRRVRLISKDDRQNPEAARKAVRELINEGVVAIIGPMTSDMAVAVTPLLNEARMLTVSPTATTQLLSRQDDYFFRVTSTTREFAFKSARYNIESEAMRRIAAVYDKNNSSFCENWLENFQKFFTDRGGKIIRTIGYRVDADQSFMEIARELLSVKPDGVLIIANSMDSALLCQQIRKFDSRIRITLADWGATERLLELGGKAVEGVTVVQTFDRESRVPRYQQFRKAFMERYHREPGFPGVYTHDATQVVLSALRAQKAGESLKKTVLRLKRFQGLQSDFSFDAYGDVSRLLSSISIVQNQKFVVLE